MSDMATSSDSLSVSEMTDATSGKGRVGEWPAVVDDDRLGGPAVAENDDEVP